MEKSKSVYNIIIDGYNAGAYSLSDDQVRVFKWLRAENDYDIELEPLNIGNIKEI